jgi:tRNA(fMet)-specific endonuclease VapC
MGVVVDTSALINIERRGGDLGDLVALAQRERAFVATISLSELLVGALRADSIARRVRRESFVDDLIANAMLAPFDEHAARAHAYLLADMTAHGQLIGAHDMLIAATALSLFCDVLTVNVRDFGRVPGLVVRQPNW